VPFRISMPSRDVPGRPGTDLQLTAPGAHPLLVNGNCTPVGRTPARPHDARTRLPVLHAPTRAEDLAPPTDDRAEGAGAYRRRRARCFAADPDLLGTVSQIAGGTSVVIDRDADPSAAGVRSGGGRDPQEVDGEQVASDAARWIDELQALTDGGCVVSLPGAQA